MSQEPWDSKTAASSVCAEKRVSCRVIGLFCDPYVANTNLEGGHSAPRRGFGFRAPKGSEETLSDVAGWLGRLKTDGKTSEAISEASKLFEEAARLGNEGRGAFGSGPKGAAAWVVSLREKLSKLREGQLLLAPGGWINNKEK
ncbi:unnamed protein product [Effrenium voratum]|uniref:Uncharacterized protein n=1 Tax=Effrenium voratum TaxID=2562239 RepID=A0AA36INK9_9DINO|nr:unnamed protein product [Effrenium voratum]